MAVAHEPEKRCDTARPDAREDREHDLGECLIHLVGARDQHVGHRVRHAHGTERLDRGSLHVEPVFPGAVLLVPGDLVGGAVAR
ncbi:MAG: hypothetical protein AAF074_24035 [Pseudomonadota bacterium]